MRFLLLHLLWSTQFLHCFLVLYPSEIFCSFIHIFDNFLTNLSGVEIEMVFVWSFLYPILFSFSFHFHLLLLHCYEFLQGFIVTFSKGEEELLLFSREFWNQWWCSNNSSHSHIRKFTIVNVRKYANTLCWAGSYEKNVLFIYNKIKKWTTSSSVVVWWWQLLDSREEEIAEEGVKESASLYLQAHRVRARIENEK